MSWPVNIHTANALELRQCHGIGPSRAQQIIELRNQTQLTPYLLSTTLKTPISLWEDLIKQGCLTFKDGGAMGNLNMGAPCPRQEVSPLEEAFSLLTLPPMSFPPPGGLSGLGPFGWQQPNLGAAGVHSKGDEQPTSGVADQQHPREFDDSPSTDAFGGRQQGRQLDETTETYTSRGGTRRASNMDVTFAIDMVDRYGKYLDALSDRLEVVRNQIGCAPTAGEVDKLKPEEKSLHQQISVVAREHGTWRSRLATLATMEGAAEKGPHERWPPELQANVNSSAARCIDDAHDRLVESSSRPATKSVVASTPVPDRPQKVQQEDIAAVLSHIPRSGIFRSPMGKVHDEESLQFQVSPDSDNLRTAYEYPPDGSFNGVRRHDYRQHPTLKYEEGPTVFPARQRYAYTASMPPSHTISAPPGVSQANVRFASDTNRSSGMPCYGEYESRNNRDHYQSPPPLGDYQPRRRLKWESSKKQRREKHRSRWDSDSSSDSVSDSSSSDSEEESSSEDEESRRSRRHMKHKRRDRQRKRSPNAPHMQLFKGGVNEWENFIFFFQNAVTQYKWDKKKRLERLKECLREKAVEHVCTLPKATVRSYKKLLKALEKRFGSDIRPHILRKNLFEMRQEPSEGLDDFADRVQHIVQRAYKDTSRKTISVMGAEVFLKGIRDKSSSRHAAHQKPKDVRSALEYVKEAAAIDHFFGRPVSTRLVTFEDEAFVRQGRLSDQGYSNHQNSRGGNWQNSNSSAPQYPARNQRSPSPIRDRDRCFNCNEVGHFKRDCPLLSHLPRASYPRQSGHREMATSPGRPSSRSASRDLRPASPGRGTQTDPGSYSQDKSVYHGSSLNTPGWTMVVPLLVNDQPVEAIVDTASQVTLLGALTAEKLGLAPENDSSIRIQGIGDSMEMKAQIVRDVDLKLGNQHVIWDVIVGPARELCILGIDFLNHVHADINLGTSCIYINGTTVPAEIRANRQPEATMSAVATSEEYVVPPFSGRVVQCRLSWIMRSQFLIEPVPLPNLKNQMLIPNVLLNRKSSTQLHVFNTSDEVIRIPMATTIASAVEIEDVITLGDWKDEPLQVSELFGSRRGGNGSGNVNVIDDFTADSYFGATSAKRMSTDSHFNSYQGADSTEETDIPEHLRAMFESSRTQLAEEESQQLKKLLIEFQDIFAQHDFDLGEFTALSHKIDTGDSKPVKCGLRRTPLGFQDQEEEHLKKMVDAGIIQASTSDWAAAPVIVKKKCGSYRYCLDYRGLNNVTRKDNFPLPLIEECLDALADNCYFSTLDMASGYWQIMIDPASRHKTAFLTKYGLYEHVRLAMGLCNSPATYQRAMTLVLKDMLWKEVLAYLDDVIILGHDFATHLHNLQKVFHRVRKYNLKFKPKKCVLFGTSVDFLGRRVSREGVSIPEAKVKCVEEWARPATKTQLEAFLGFINYHRVFIPHLAEKASPLYELVKISTSDTPISWSETQEAAFLLLKQAMVTAPVLGYPRPQDLFILDTDASDHSIGAQLSQVQDGKEVVIAYASMSLNLQQRRYCTTRKELLALVMFLSHYRFYLLGQSFLVRTDHNSLTWLMRFRKVEGQLARWIESISQFDFKIEHRAGKLHGNADGLSRIPESCDCYDAGKDVTTLPCGGCKHCTNKHQQWQRFQDYVDDVIPLASRVTTIHQDPPEDPRSRFDEGTDWPTEQSKDPELNIVRQWMREGTTPAAEVLYLQGGVTKRLWMLRRHLTLQDDILCYNWLQGKGQPTLHLIVAPMHCRDRILRLAHDAKTSGHPGQHRTKLNALRRFFWPGLSTDVRQFVESCKICNTLKKGNRSRRAPMKIHHAGLPMERIHIDILGPFIESTLGNRYVLVMVDQFTKWSELAPLADQTAEAVAQALIQQFLCRMGCANELFSDQGTNFQSALFNEVCSLFDMAKRRTTPYHPSANGQVERLNREILFKVRAYLDSRYHQKDWDTYLPFIGMALRSTVNESTGYSPNMMMLGRETTVPLDLMAGPLPMTTVEPASNYVKQLRETLHGVHSFAREQLGKSLHRRKTTYDRRNFNTKYDVGDLVYILNNACKKGYSRKLQSIYEGPYLVTACVSEVLYQVQGRGGKKRQVIHHDRLKPCNDRDIPMWIRRDRVKLQVADDLSQSVDETLNLSGLWEEADEDRDPDPQGVSPDSDEPPDSQDESRADEGAGTTTGDLSSPPLRSPSERHHNIPSGSRRMTRPSRPPSWLKDYVM